jgi:hypothetical protein
MLGAAELVAVYQSERSLLLRDGGVVFDAVFRIDERVAGKEGMVVGHG